VLLTRRTRRRAVPALTIGALLAGALVVGQAAAGTPMTSPVTTESVNLALEPGAVASAKSQRTTAPELTYAPANAIDVFVHNGWTSNFAAVGNGYDPTHDWFQVRLADPAPVYEVFTRWTSPSKPTEYEVQVSTDAGCETWTTVAHVTNPDDKDAQVIDHQDPVRCVRMQGLATTSTAGYTINEFELWSGPKPAPVVGKIIPVPVRQTPGSGQPWELTRTSRIVVSDSSLTATAEVLAGYLRPATGFVLPVVTGAATAADIALNLGAVSGLPADKADEGYSLTVSSAGAGITAPQPHGLFNGFTSLRQLLPAAINASVTPAANAASGPMTASSTASRRANATSAS
jgi:hexosaminidase